VGINERHPVPALEILPQVVLNESRLARTGFPDDVEVLAPIRARKTDGRVGD
jgi:hypothetical protein